MKSKDGGMYTGKYSGNDVTVHVFSGSFHTAMEIAATGFLGLSILCGLAMCIHGFPFGS